MTYTRVVYGIGCVALLVACAKKDESTAADAKREPASYDIKVEKENAASLVLLESALPTSSDDFVFPPGANTSGQGWALFGGSDQQSPAEIQSVVDVLQSPLAANLPVQEIYNEKATGQIAVSTCKGNQPVIYYSPTDLALFDARTTEFIKEHELAHHRLGQVVCTGPEPKFPRYDEKAADCAATHTLLAQGQHGHDVIISITSVLFHMNVPAKGLYPSTHDRAAYIESGCV